MGTVAVVTLDVDPQDLLQVAATDDQQPVQALGADRPPQRSAYAFALGARTASLGLATHRARHLVEAAGELRVPIANKEAHPSPSLFQHQ